MGHGGWVREDMVDHPRVKCRPDSQWSLEPFDCERRVKVSLSRLLVIVVLDDSVPRLRKVFSESGLSLASLEKRTG